MLRLNGRRQTPDADAHARRTETAIQSALSDDLLTAVAAWRGPEPG
jgi:hypothetical protein